MEANGLLLKIFLLLLLLKSCHYDAQTTTVVGCCGEWSPWTIVEPCNDTCGNCGSWTRSRSCMTTTCQCSGPSMVTEPCNNSPCHYPRTTCCCPSILMNSGNGNPICTSQSSITTSPCSGTCCPIGGMWSEWIPLGVCNDTCGGFGIIRRRRTCLTGPNCSCRGYSVRPFRCQLSPCIYPRLACVPGYSVQVVNGVIRCAQIPVSTIKVSTSSISTITTRPTTRTTTTTRASCCPNGGLWSPWGSWSSCNATCGACGLTKRTRLCGSAAYGCPCSSATGTTSETLPCNRQPCLYPISSCCSPYKLAKIGINFLCWTTTTSTSSTALPPTTRITSSLPVTTRTTTTAPTTTTAAPTMTTTTAALATTTKQAGTCCPTGGMWSEWTQLGTCSDTCGAFGTAPYNRICLTGPICSCSGSSTKTDFCNYAPCAYPRNSCNKGMSAKVINSQILCGATTATTAQPTASCCPTSGLWSPWGSWSRCTDTCGLCGTQTRTRLCGSAAYRCPCANAESMQTQACGTTPCMYPRNSCCSPYSAQIVSNQVVCAA